MQGSDAVAQIIPQVGILIKLSDAFPATVKELIAFTSDRRRVDRIYKEIRQNAPHCRPPNDYIDAIRRYIEELTQIYFAICESTKNVLSIAEGAAAACAEKEENVRDKRRNTALLGGTAAAATLAVGAGTGIIISIVAGACTFGVGTIVGLSLTAAGTAASGLSLAGAGAAATGYVVYRAKESEEFFCDLKENYKSMIKIDPAGPMQCTCRCLCEKLQLIKAYATDAIHNNTASPEYLLDQLQERLAQLDPTPVENACNKFKQVFQ